MDTSKLQSLPLFEGLSDNDLADCASHFHTTEMVAGASLAKEGDFAYKFFIVLHGTAEVYRDFDFVAKLNEGDFFGEMGILSHGKRNARVTAKDRVELAWMMGWDFEEMSKKYPEIGARVEAVVAERMTSLPNETSQEPDRIGYRYGR
jgi:CRP-like cAMP-binding protein